MRRRLLLGLAALAVAESFLLPPLPASPQQQHLLPSTSAGGVRVRLYITCCVWWIDWGKQVIQPPNRHQIRVAGAKSLIDS